MASTAPPTFVLIASPLVGPAGWRWLASELSSRGSPVVVPELAPADAPAPVWPAHVARILEQVPAGAVVLVGHSAAGRLVPLVAAGRADPSICVFVDAQLPVDLLAPDADEWFHAHVRSIAVGDVLPPWSEWWGPEAWDALVADPDRRTELADALPRLTVAAATEVPPAPDQPVRRAAYLRLSPVFDRQADVARALGWPVLDLDGGHLHPAVAEAAVAEAIVELVARGPGRLTSDEGRHVGDKSVLVIALLGERGRRFSELKVSIDGISQRMLTLTLRQLERDGIVSRTVHATVPPRVDYALTDLGQSVLDPLQALTEWAASNGTVIAARREYDDRRDDAAGAA